MNQKRTLAKELLKIAKRDVKASSLLYGQKLYPQSYFYFQQATEKATKSYFLFLEIVNEKKVFDVRHNLFKLHKKVLVQAQEHNKKALDMIGMYPFLQVAGLEKKKLTKRRNSIQDELSLFDKLKDYDLINISSKNIQFFLDNLESLNVKAIKMPEDLSLTIENYFRLLLDDINKYNSEEAIQMAKALEDSLTDPEWTNFIHDHFKEAIRAVLDSIFIYSTLFFTSFLTIQHSSISRYPNNENPAITPLEIYSKKLPLVKWQPDFLENLKRAIILIEHNFKNE